LSRADEPPRLPPPPAPEGAPVSKTRRKAAMLALQDVGEALVALDNRDLTAFLSEVEVPERLRDAIMEARRIRAHGGRKRQLQYVGRLMREVDATPFVQWLDTLAHGRHHDAARQHALERWRDRLLEEPDALDELAASYPALDRPRMRSLVARARAERASGAVPHAYRELFRSLNALLNAPSPP
jgi:ribosome-associated protein